LTYLPPPLPHPLPRPRAQRLLQCQGSRVSVDQSFSNICYEIKHAPDPLGIQTFFESEPGSMKKQANRAKPTLGPKRKADTYVNRQFTRFFRCVLYWAEYVTLHVLPGALTAAHSTCALKTLYGCKIHVRVQYATSVYTSETKARSDGVKWREGEEGTPT
jgi:hypothetical protein